MKGAAILNSEIGVAEVPRTFQVETLVSGRIQVDEAGNPNFQVQMEGTDIHTP